MTAAKKSAAKPVAATPRPARETKLPDTNQASIKESLTVLATTLVSIIGLRYIARDLIAPILMAVFFAALMFPFFSRLRRRGFRSAWAMILMLLVFVAGIIGIVLFTTWSFQLVSASLQPVFEQYQSFLNNLITGFGIDTSSATSIAHQLSPNQIMNFVMSILGQFGNVTLYFVLVPIMAVLIVLHVDSLPPSILQELTTQNSAISKAKQFANTISLYLSNRFKINMITGALMFVLLTIMNVQFAVIWGVLTMVMSFIPYIGIVIAGAPPTILAFINGGIPAAAVVVIGLLLINTFVENVLEPMIQGSSHKISTAVVVIAFVFWTWLLGPVGAILSTPLTVLLKIILSDYQETSWIAAMIEGRYEQTKTELKKRNGLSGWWNTLPLKGWINRNSS